MKLSSVKFKARSYITVENKFEDDNFYIIRRGKVKVFSSLIQDDSFQSIKGPGDFFAVVSSMTGHPRLSSAYAMEDTELISVRKQQFGFLIQQSAPLALKIIRSFSNELRKYDEMLVQKTLLTKKMEEDPDSLYRQGEFYFNKGEQAIAAYIYTQYIKNFSYSELAVKSQERLKSMDPDILNNVHKVFEKGLNRRYNEGDILFSEFEPGFEMFIIESGAVKISKVIDDKEVLIAVLKKGDIFGEMALLNNENRSATAIASKKTSLTVLNQKNFNNIIKKNVLLAVRIIVLLSERLWTIYKQLDNFYFSDVKNRIYDTLATQVQKKHIKTSTSASHLFDFGPKEIKSMLGIEEGLVMEAVEEILGEDIIEVQEDRFFCKSLIKLEKEINFARKMEQRKRKIEENQYKI